MVGMMRLESDSTFNSDPPKLPDDELYEKVCNIIERRVEDIDSDELEATLAAMQSFIEDWEDWNPKRWEPKWNPDWSYADPLPLMYSAGSHPNEAWGEQGVETPTSMRSVDASCQAKIIERRYERREG